MSRRSNHPNAGSLAVLWKIPITIASHLYGFITYVYRFAVDIRWITQPAFRLADTPLEQMSVLGFATKLVAARSTAVLSRFIDERVLSDDTPIILRGTKYYVGLRANETALLREIYAERSYDQVEDFISREGWVVVDVGANIGIFAIQQALRGAKVYAFDPNPNCFRRLARTVAENGLSERVRTFNYAIGATAGIGKMVVQRGFTPGGSVIAVESEDSESNNRIQIESLDSVTPLLGISSIDLIKIDTEGAELEVLQGALHTLEITERVVLEYHSHDQLDHLKTFLMHYGFAEILQRDDDPTAGRGIYYAKKAD